MKCSTSSTTGGRRIPLHALLSLTHDLASLCLQSAGKCQAGIGKTSFSVPDSLIVAYGSPLFQKESLRRIFCKFLWLKGKRGANFQSVSADVPSNSWLASLFGLDKRNLISAGISLPAKPTYSIISFRVCAWPQFGSRAYGTTKKYIKDLSREPIHPCSNALGFLVQSYKQQCLGCTIAIQCCYGFACRSG